MKILVTGGAGFIGSHLVKRLLNEGFSVVCVDNFNNFYDPQVKERNVKNFINNPNFRLYREDIRNFEVLSKIFERERIDKIVHLAAMAGVRNSIRCPSLYTEVNIPGTVNLLELAKKYKISNFVFASSSSVYGGNKKVPFSEDDPVNYPISPYAAAKKAGELICYTYHHLYNLNITCLRFFTVYGPAGRPDMAPYKFTRLVLKGDKILMFGDGSSQRSYTYVDDIIEGISSALDKELGYEIINLGGSELVSLKNFISLIENISGRKAKIKRALEQPGDMPITYADISKAKRLLNYAPRTNLEKGMTIFISWFKKYGK
ncbi:MAG: GDP-mannose 4,6-dehydratase [Candidatus Pacebacteria bacterium]|nr:GDP-mannose 4,6-dehydratase [Candidatus Paceibacterota bacterium]